MYGVVLNSSLEIFANVLVCILKVGVTFRETYKGTWLFDRTAFFGCKRPQLQNPPLGSNRPGLRPSIQRSHHKIQDRVGLIDLF